MVLTACTALLFNLLLFDPILFETILFDLLLLVRFQKRNQYKSYELIRGLFGEVAHFRSVHLTKSTLEIQFTNHIWNHAFAKGSQSPLTFFFLDVYLLPKVQK